METEYIIATDKIIQEVPHAKIFNKKWKLCRATESFLA